MTTVSDSLYGQVTRDVMNYIGEKIKTRTTSSITEVEAKKIVSPLSDVGASICNELIVLADEDMLEMSDQEKTDLLNLQPDQLAAIAYFLHSTQLVATDLSQTEDVSSGALYSAGYSWSDVSDCLWTATGFETLSGIYGYAEGTATLCTAKTAFKVARAFIGRTLGWIGVAVAIYDFANCMNGK